MRPPFTGVGTIIIGLAVVGGVPDPVYLAVLGKMLHCGTVQHGSLLSATNEQVEGMLLNIGHLSNK